jgi:hypothetical protein
VVRLFRGTDPEGGTEPSPPVETAWCDTCARPLADGEVATSIDGEPICRTCGDLVEFEVDEGPTRAPWHFKILLLGTIGYLVYRLIWFIEWLQHH